MVLTSLLRTCLNRSTEPFLFSSKNNTEILDVNCINAGLYIHIPFCKKICPFCPYNKVLYNKELALRFKDSLLKEIDLIGNFVKNKPFKTVSLYYGGGSPALMADNLPEINKKLKEYFIIDNNKGIELHPENINPLTMDLIKEADFDMISIGVQSFDKDVLNNLGRDYLDNIQILKTVSGLGFKAIDIDLIFGFQGSTTQKLIDDFKKAVDNGATQISTYPFIDFLFKNNTTKPLSSNERKKMLEALVRASEEVNFERTSIWTFSQKGTPKYSSVTRDNFIGFGPSATSLLNDTFKINTFDVEAYIKTINKDKIPTALTHKFSLRSRLTYWLFWSSYNMEINKNSFNLLFDKKLDDFFNIELKLGKALGLLSYQNNKYQLTDKGAYLFHLIEQEYTQQYISKTWEIMLQNPWPESIILY